MYSGQGTYRDSGGLPSVCKGAATAMQQRTPTFSKDTTPTLSLKLVQEFPPEKLTVLLTEHWAYKQFWVESMPFPFLSAPGKAFINAHRGR